MYLKEEEAEAEINYLHKTASNVVFFTIKGKKILGLFNKPLEFSKRADEN
jgi:hypothetical protein